MYYLILICAAISVAAPASAEIVRTLSQDPDSGSWSMGVPKWTAVLSGANLDDMEATLELRPDIGEAITTKIDMMAMNLPLLASIDEVILCSDTPEIIVSTADLIQDEQNGTFVYRRFVFSHSEGFLGVVNDDASASAHGLLPAAVVANDLLQACKIQ